MGSHTAVSLPGRDRRERNSALPGIDRVEIVHDQANTASGGIPRRLGFTKIQRRARTQGGLAPGEVGMEVVWQLTRS